MTPHHRTTARRSASSRHLSGGGIKPSAARALTVALALSSATAHAHRLDEILQSALLSIATDHIELELHLTPGIETVATLEAILDPDRNGQITEAEAGPFAQMVRTNLQLVLDDRSLELAFGGAKCPTLDALKEGTGTVSLRFTAAANLSPGGHALRFHNGYRPLESIYLAHALQPESPDLIHITGQQRRGDQREITLSFERRITARAAPVPASASPGAQAPKLRGWHLFLAALAGILACLGRARAPRAKSGSLAADR